MPAFSFTPAFTYAHPDAARCDCLYQRTSFLIGDLTGSPFIGADGTLTTQPNTIPAFDLRPYSGAIIYAYLDGFTGGTAPSINIGVAQYDSPGIPPLYRPVAYCNSQGLAAAGGTTLLMGENGAVPVTNTGVAGVNSFPIAYSYKPLFAHLQLNVTGSPTGLTGLRVFLYGVR